MIQLREYQHEAVQALYDHLRTRDDNPCVVIPTAGGKTPVMAQVCMDAARRWNGRVLVLAHVRELLEQTAGTLCDMAPELDIGIYSAGLNSRDTEHAVIVAGIQSVYKRACELGLFDLVMIDEAHMIPPDGEGMYRTFLSEARVLNPNVRLIGLTATPYRMKTGMICAPDSLLNHVCYEIGVRELIVQGYLCPLKTKAGKEKVDTSGLHIRAGEFIQSETEELMDRQELVRSACAEIVEYTRDRHSCLVFASGVDHARHICEVLRVAHHVECDMVFGETPSRERDAVLERFRAGELPYVVNVNVLTTGFDAPNIDCVALLRPTLSPGLYYQSVGRGFRIHPSKQDSLVLDYGGNVMRHGPVDAIRIQDGKTGGPAPAKECPQCRSIVAMGYSVCPDCGYEFFKLERERKANHAASAGSESILSGDVTSETYPVQEVVYSVHHKRGAPEDHPRSMRVEYRLGWSRWQSEWVCFEHTGYAQHKAELWWKRRSSTPVPETAEEAVTLAQDGALCETKSITVRSVAGEEFDHIVGYELGEKPSHREPGWDDELLEADGMKVIEITDGTIPF